MVEECFVGRLEMVPARTHYVMRGALNRELALGLQAPLVVNSATPASDSNSRQ